MRRIFNWTLAGPILAWLLYFSGLIGDSAIYNVLAVVFLMISVLAAVHHAEVVGHKVGEPFGTIILAIAVTILESAIIISLMLAGGEGAQNYARDTLFSAVMIILNGILGISMWVGARKYAEQEFESKSVTIALVALVSIIVLTLILPNYTTTVPGPYYNKPQLIFVSIACIVIYVSFIITQTVRHRDYFLSDADTDEISEVHISKRDALISLFLLVTCLAIVILLAKKLSPVIENSVEAASLPKALVGVVVSLVILMPEGISAVRAAARNRFQNSINLALGSAIASIGLTIPTVALICIFLDLPLTLGLDKKSMILLALSLFTVMLSLNKSRTNMTYAIVLITNLAAFIFTIIYH